MNVRNQIDLATLTMDIATTSLTSDLRECAILLDIDGTILDIAPAPQEVWCRRRCGIRWAVCRS